MQFMVDISHDPVEQLRMVQHLLGEAIKARTPEQTDTKTADAPPPPPPPPASDAPPPPPPGPSPAEVFGKQEQLPDAFKPGVERTPPNPTEATVAAEEVDSAGQKWDATIHSSSRAKLRDGTWKKRRGGPVTPPPPPMTPPSTTTTTAAAPPPPPPGYQTSPPAPPPPPAETAAPIAPTGPTFRSVVAKCTAATAAGKITHDAVRAICVQAGAPDLMTLNAMPGLIPTVDALIDAALLGK